MSNLSPEVREAWETWKKTPHFEEVRGAAYGAHQLVELHWSLARAFEAGYNAMLGKVKPTYDCTECGKEIVVDTTR